MAPASKSTPRRIGILGGTFDPPHIGHLTMAVEVRDALGLHEVLLVVAHEPWQKVGERRISPSADRLAMVEAAVADLDGVEPCDLEIRRGGPSYTADTLAELAEASPEAELWLILGADAAAGLPTWERGDEVREQARIVVAAREGETGPPPPGWAWEVVPMTRIDVSSTELRARVAAGRTIEVLVPAGARAEIEARRLYGSSE
jgi:nicotinate-nucleotide adenylyltransferase